MSFVCHLAAYTRHPAAAIFACALMATTAHGEAAQPVGKSCHFTTIGSATIRAVTDDGVLLDDGRTLRLDGVADIAGTELRALLPAGVSVVLKRLGAAAETDRYGRTVAHVFLAKDATETWVEADLIARGFALLSPRLGDMACARELQLAEQSARAAKLGLWAEAYYVINNADSPAEVLKRRGRFALVEGKVISVRERGGTIYVNFGRRWSEDFTVTVAKRNERAFVAAGLEPKKLAGRQVRIRGWIEQRGGPWVEASRPEQIEVVERN